MKLFVLFILAVFASEKEENVAGNGSENGERYGLNNVNNSILGKIEEDDYERMNKKSKFIGVSYNKRNSKWKVQRRGAITNVFNGYYDDEETAAHASDTLARKLMDNSERKLNFNFPDNHTEVYPEEESSKYIGVSYYKKYTKWRARRWSKVENKHVCNGYYDDEETAAHASDTLARKLMENDKQKLKINFPDDYTKVYREKSSKCIGVSYHKNNSKWKVQRRSKVENKVVYNGYYDDEETAAHASDTLARKLMENGEQNHKLNFPDDGTEVFPENKYKKRKRPKN